jgi:hypothetical protein
MFPDLIAAPVAKVLLEPPRLSPLPLPSTTPETELETETTSKHQLLLSSSGPAAAKAGIPSPEQDREHLTHLKARLPALLAPHKVVIAHDTSRLLLLLTTCKFHSLK